MQLWDSARTLNAWVRFRRQELCAEHLDIIPAKEIAFKRLRSVSLTGILF